MSAIGARTAKAKPAVKVTVGTLPPPQPPIQLAPTSGTVSTTGSAAFTDQLNASGGYWVATYATTAPNSGLLVSPTGAVSTTGALAVGTYTVSGTITALIPPVGTWTYTLTVTAPPPPGSIAIAAGQDHPVR